jgi:hypothetical protein
VYGGSAPLPCSRPLNSPPPDASFLPQTTPASTPGPAATVHLPASGQASPCGSGGRSRFERWRDASPRSAESDSVPWRKLTSKSFCEVAAAGRMDTAPAPVARPVCNRERCDSSVRKRCVSSTDTAQVVRNTEKPEQLVDGWQLVESKQSKRHRLKMERQHQRRPVPEDLAGRCFNCLSQDHFAFQCTQKTRCFRCREQGHRSFECSLLKRPVRLEAVKVAVNNSAAS